MPTIQLKDGYRATHNHSERMVALATTWLREYFSDQKARRPGDLEDDFAGRWSIDQAPWRSTPFYPALALLIEWGEIAYETDDEGTVWYAVPGSLPSNKLLEHC